MALYRRHGSPYGGVTEELGTGSVHHQDLSPSVFSQLCLEAPVGFGSCAPGTTFRDGAGLLNTSIPPAASLGGQSPPPG